MCPSPNIPDTSSLPPIVEEDTSDEGNMKVASEMEAIDNYQLIFPSWSMRMKKRRKSLGKEKEVMGIKTMLSGIETVTNWS